MEQESRTDLRVCQDQQRGVASRKLVWESGDRRLIGLLAEGRFHSLDFWANAKLKNGGAVWMDDTL